MTHDNDDFFAEIGWPPAGYNKDGKPWHLIPPDVLKTELELRGYDVDEDREVRVKRVSWRDIIADWPDQSQCLLEL